MENNVIFINEWMMKRNPNYIKIGDIVEWVDYDDSIQVGKITKIVYTHPITKKKTEKQDVKIPYIPMEKEAHTLYLENGLSISGKIFLRKLKKTVFNKIAGRKH